jgi:hypothetical protein
MGKGEFVRVRGVYATPWSKLAGQKLEVTPVVMQMLGKAVLEGVRHEIRRTVALANSVKGRGNAIPLPNSVEFIESFQFKIVGAKTVAISTDWPFAKVWEEGKEPYEMTWLKQPKVKVVPIITSTGETILRTAPLQTDKAWIHPGFARYGFLQKGIKRGREEAALIVRNEIILPMLKKSSPL